jgi:hypothetical protein
MPFTGPEIEPAPPFQPVRTGQGTVASLAEAEEVLISTAACIQISSHLAEADGAYPYQLPVHDSAITGTGTGMPGADTRQHEEWHHADPPPRGAGGWDATRESGPPPDRTDEGVFIAGDDDGQHGWDIGPASPAPPCGTPRLGRDSPGQHVLDPAHHTDLGRAQLRLRRRLRRPRGQRERITLHGRHGQPVSWACHHAGRARAVWAGPGRQSPLAASSMMSSASSGRSTT